MLNVTTINTSSVLREIDEMASAITDGSLVEALLWKRLWHRHQDALKTYGFENFKRTVNFQYGQWGISAYHDRFTMRLLFALLRRGRVPSVAARPDFNDAMDIQWPRGGSAEHRLRAYALYCGWLWQYAQQSDSLGCLQIPEPAFGHPMPIWKGDRLISQDIAVASLILNHVNSAAPLSSARRVLEIGAGYGRLAYITRSLFPEIQYTIVDIPPALALSQNYLAIVFGEKAIERYNERPSLGKTLNFLLPHQCDTIPDGYFDLAINYSSFDEMPSHIVLNYLRLIERSCRGHVYLGGYARPAHSGDYLGLEELPYNVRWQIVYNRKHEIFTGFVEKVFKLH